VNTQYLADKTATEAFGAGLAGILDQAGLVTFSGQLGAGKTTLIRGLMHALGHKGAVKSPTYTLVEPYDLGDRQVMHFDLYRLADPEELEFLGFRDYLDGYTLCLIEWPERGENFLPPADLSLQLSVKAPGRQISWQAHSHRGDRFSQRLAALFPN
jgi:tRNA threonylcarbamoyladenosine biosynthesis protein TsaE